MISHIELIVVAEAEDLDLARVARHNIFERLLNTPETLVDSLDEIHAALQGNLKMRGALYRPALKEIIGVDTNLVAPGKGGGQDLWIVVDLREEHCLIQEL